MDTKQLHQTLVDNNIELDMDSVGDAETAWIQAIFESEEDFADTFADYMAEMKPSDFTHTHQKLAGGYKDVTQIVDGHIGSDTILTSTWAASIALQFTHAASKIALNHAAQITKLVESMADTWMADCMGYDIDMNEGRSEDAAMFRADR
jgi:hypothetical protein